MLKRFNRYPLIIDPSGQATTFICNEYKDRKITRTRYINKQFGKYSKICVKRPLKKRQNKDLNDK